MLAYRAMHATTKRAAFGVLALTLTLGLTACGEDEDEPAETGDAPTTTEAPTTTTAGEEAEEDEGQVVVVTAVDYAFEDLPATVEAGTRLSLTNASTVEAHELVAVRIPDEETRPVSELVALPPEELAAVFGGAPEPATVILAAPGETDVPGPVVGDGTLTEPGRYAVVCFFPVGGDPAVVLDPNAEGPPETDGPRHVSQGMFAELLVE